VTAWTNTALGDLVTIVGGGTPTRNNPDYYDGPIPWVTPKDMKSWEIHGAQVTITQSGLDNSATRLVPANSILVVVRSGVLKHTIPVGLNRISVAINQDMKALRCRDGVDPDFLARFIKARSQVILQWVRATTADNFPIDKLKALPVPLPPLPEQRRIAEVLDRAEALRAKRRAALAQLDTLTQSIFLDLFGDPAKNPKRFPIKQLADLVREDDTINYGVVQPGDDLDGGVPLVRVGDLLEGRISQASLKRIAPTIEATYKRSRLRGDEILVSCVGSIGVVALVDETAKGFNIARAVARIPLAGATNREFIAAYLKTDFVQRYFTNELRTVSQPTLNIKQLSETAVVLPPSPLQLDFARRIAAVDKLKSAHRASLAKLDALFASLQHRAFRGEL
jgi:type I restriction enzyme S subunit